MITFQESTIIPVSIEKVFSYVADPNQIPNWRRDVPGISRLSGVPNVGTTFYEQVNFMGKKQLLMKVTEYLPNRKLVIEAQSGMPLLPTQSFSFSSSGSGTKIDLTVTMKVSGIFKLLQPVLPRQLKKIWRGYFKALNENLKTG